MTNTDMTNTDDTLASADKKGLADDAPVDLQAEFEASHVKDVIDKLDRELVGLVPVKTRIRETHGWEAPRMSYIVNRPSNEPGFKLHRMERNGRSMGYTIEPYATDKPEGDRP